MKPKLFYGWYIVIAGAINNAVIGGFTFYGFTALMDPIARTMGWSYAQISLGMSIRGLEAGILSPFLGKAVDRLPARWLILFGTVIIGLGYILMSRVTTLALFYASFMITALGISLGITMAPMATLARWFRKNIGKATGILAMGIGLGGLLTPILVRLITAFGWRTSVIIMAAIILIIGIPLSFIFRNRPEDYGMFPDGEKPIEPGRLEGKETYDFSMGVKEALMSRSFWYYGLASLLQIAGNSAAILHLMPCLTNLGVERSTAGMVAMFVPMVSIPLRFVFGVMADMMKKKYVLAISIGATAAALVVFSTIDADSFILIVFFVLFLGLSVSGVMVVRAPFIREYFGTKNFGTILGLQFVFGTIGMVVAPPLAGWFYDTTGDYDLIWLILGGGSVLATVLILLTPPPSKLSRDSNFG